MTRKIILTATLTIGCHLAFGFNVAIPNLNTIPVTTGTAKGRECPTTLSQAGVLATRNVSVIDNDSPANTQEWLASVPPGAVGQCISGLENSTLTGINNDIVVLNVTIAGSGATVAATANYGLPGSSAILFSYTLNPVLGVSGACNTSGSCTNANPNGCSLSCDGAPTINAP